MHLNYFYFEGPDTHLWLKSMAFLINSIAESSWLESTKLMDPLGPHSTAIPSDQPYLFGCILHGMKSATQLWQNWCRLQLLQTTVGSTPETMKQCQPICPSLTSPAPQGSRLWAVARLFLSQHQSCKLQDTTKEKIPQSIWGNSQATYCISHKKAPDLSKASLSRRWGDGKFLTVHTVWYKSVFWYLALHGNFNNISNQYIFCSARYGTTGSWLELQSFHLVRCSMFVSTPA